MEKKSYRKIGPREGVWKKEEELEEKNEKKRRRRKRRRRRRKRRRRSCWRKCWRRRGCSVKKRVKSPFSCSFTRRGGK